MDFKANTPEINIPHTGRDVIMIRVCIVYVSLGQIVMIDIPSKGDLEYVC